MNYWQQNIVFISILLLVGCSTKNQVTRIEQPDSVINYKKNAAKSSRFSNLYPEKYDYPVSCQENCYQASPWLECESPAENCHYIGENLPIKLNTELTIRWLGHASFSIVSSNGTRLLLDPVSKQFDWPVDLAFKLAIGFYRNEPQWLSHEELTNVDAVLYSHIHYDHFSKSDIETLGNNTEYFTPLGFGEHFPDGGYRINEMSWYSKKTLADFQLNFVPAHHFSNRIWVPFLYEDNDATLWGGWVIEHKNKKIFFAGDTGYSEHFKNIQQRYGDMDVCLLPIASYFHPEDGEWYRYVHTTPEDALLAAQDLNCKVMIPWGYGNNSWKMGDRSSHSPLLRLLNMHKQLNSTIPLHILNEGEEVRF